MKTKIVILLALLFIINSSVFSISLWTEESTSIYQDRQPFVEGDIITVNIEEDASAIQSASTDTSQSSKMELESRGRFGFRDFLASLLLGYSEEDRADGETNRQGRIEAQITTKVVEIEENGNLRIEGEKRLIINEEDQIITLTGIIRGDDVTLENEVPSHRVAEAVIEYKGEGVVAEKQRPGFFSRLFNWLL